MRAEKLRDGGEIVEQLESSYTVAASQGAEKDIFQLI